MDSALTAVTPPPRSSPPCAQSISHIRSAYDQDMADMRQRVMALEERLEEAKGGQRSVQADTERALASVRSLVRETEDILDTRLQDEVKARRRLEDIVASAPWAGGGRQEDEGADRPSLIMRKYVEEELAAARTRVDDVREAGFGVQDMGYGVWCMGV